MKFQSITSSKFLKFNSAEVSDISRFVGGKDKETTTGSGFGDGGSAGSTDAFTTHTDESRDKWDGLRATQGEGRNDGLISKIPLSLGEEIYIFPSIKFLLIGVLLYCYGSLFSQNLVTPISDCKVYEMNNLSLIHI